MLPHYRKQFVWEVGGNNFIYGAVYREDKPKKNVETS